MDRIITIDGPAGAGKTTLARGLAQALDWAYLDTGALYRALALAARQRGVDPADQAAAETLARRVKLQVQLNPQVISIDGLPVGPDLRSPEISLKASLISAWPGVRESLMRLQRDLGAGGRVVAEGRDMGTVVFPGAALKFFLSASPEVRARRRGLELEERPQSGPVDHRQVLADINQRDQADQNRAAAPLRPAPDACMVDSSHMDISQVLALMLARAREVFGL